MNTRSPGFDLTSEPADADFYRWLHKHWRRAVALLGVSSLGSIVSFVFKYAPRVATPLAPYQNYVPTVLNALTLLLLLLLLQMDGVQGGTAHRKFARWWLWVWVLWLVEYVSFCYLYFPVDGSTVFEKLKGSQVDHIPGLGWFVADAWLNVLQLSISGCIYMAYLVLAGRKGHQHAALIAVGVMVLICLGPILKSLTEMDVASYSRHLLVFNVAQAALFSISLSLLIGRFESRVIRPPLAVIAALYFYAALNLTANFWDGATDVPQFGDAAKITFERYTQLALMIAVPLKVLLYIFVYWLLRSGVLLFQVRWIRDNGEQLDRERADFVRNLPRSSNASRMAPAIPPT